MKEAVDELDEAAHGPRKLTPQEQIETVKALGFKPYRDRIAVAKLQENEQRKSGIWIPDKARDKPQRGVVLAVGPGMILPDGRHSTPAAAVGDEELFGMYSGTEIMLGELSVCILREDEILGGMPSLQSVDLTREGLERTWDRLGSAAAVKHVPLGKDPWNPRTGGLPGGGPAR